MIDAKSSKAQNFQVFVVDILCGLIMILDDIRQHIKMDLKDEDGENTEVVYMELDEDEDMSDVVRRLNELKESGKLSKNTSDVMLNKESVEMDEYEDEDELDDVS